MKHIKSKIPYSHFFSQYIFIAMDEWLNTLYLHFPLSLNLSDNSTNQICYALSNTFHQ